MGVNYKNKMRVLHSNPMCFACGRENAIGLGLKITIQKDQARATFISGVNHEGPKGLTHGGIISTVLDETMINLLWSQGKDVVTAELKVRFSRAVKIGRHINIVAKKLKEYHQVIEMEAVATDEEGSIVVRGKGKCLLRR